MKIALIDTAYQCGGSTGRIVYEIRKACEAEGIQTCIGYGFYQGNETDENTLCMQGSIRRKWNILKTRIWPRHGFYNEYETRKLISFLKYQRPDLIHLHNIHNHYLNVKMLFEYIKQYDIPVVWTLHDCWAFTGWCAYFDYSKCDKWKSICHNCKCKKDYPKTWFFDLSKSNYRLKKHIFNGVNNLTLVTPSRWLAELTRESYLKDYPVKVINNGIDLDTFSNTPNTIKEKLGLKGKHFVLAIANIFNKRKGVDFILRMPKMLKENWKVVVVGLHESQIATFKEAGCIAFGRTENLKQLAEFYSAADVFINPTLEDNFPTTNLEALACGTPVITYRTGGSAEAIDEKTGVVVEKGDEESFIEAIYNGAKLRSEDCQERAIRLYGKSERYKDYINLYKEILHE